MEFSGAPQLKMPKLEFSRPWGNEFFARSTFGSLSVITQDWLRKLKQFTLEEEMLSGTPTFTFGSLEVIEVLEIKKIDIASDWNTILSGLILIPSQSFKKLKIVTSTAISQTHLVQLTDALRVMKKEIAVEVRCDWVQL
jgi:hypothetical protein